jgi:hypothetical protein
VRIAGKILEDLLGTTKGWLDIDDPLTGAKFVEPITPTRSVSKVCQTTMELELALVEGVLEVGKEFSSKQAAQDGNGKKELVSAPDPSLPI